MITEGKLIILCGPSGSGKTTIAHHLLRLMPELSFSVSATTRARRENETDGKDYHFLSLEAFEAKITAEEFVEYEEVYKGLIYGTLKSELQTIWARTQVPVLDIDVVGALNIKKNYPEALAIFVHPITVENLKHRLHKRATETAESFEKRIHKAEDEMAMADRFDHIIYNEELDASLHQAEGLIHTYLQRS